MGYRKKRNIPHYGKVKPINYRAIYEEKFYNILLKLRWPLMVVIFTTGMGILTLMIINNKTDGKSVLNYFFHIVISISTVGYTEGYTDNVEMNRLFSIFFLMIAFPLAYLYGLVATVQIFLQSDIATIYKYWRMYKAMEKLHGHYIVCNFNKITKETIKNLRKRGFKVVLIDTDKSKEDDIRNFGVEYFIFDEPHKRSVLLGAGIEKAKGLITAFEENTQDLSVIVTARLIRPDKDEFYIIATATNEGAAEKMKLLGANEVVVPSVTIGRRISSYVLHPPSPTISRFMEQIAYGERTDIDIIEIKIPEGSPLVGKNLKDIKMRQETGATIVAIIRKDGKMKIAPSGDTIIEEGDSLLILGHPKALKRAQEFFKEYEEMIEEIEIEEKNEEEVKAE